MFSSDIRCHTDSEVSLREKLTLVTHIIATKKNLEMQMNSSLTLCLWLKKSFMNGPVILDTV